MNKPPGAGRLSPRPLRAPEKEYVYAPQGRDGKGFPGIFLHRACRSASHEQGQPSLDIGLILMCLTNKIR